MCVDIIYLVSVVTVGAAAEQRLGVQLRRVQLRVGRVLRLAAGAGLLCYMAFIIHVHVSFSVGLVCFRFPLPLSNIIRI